MNYIVDKNGKELNRKSYQRIFEWISKNMIATLTLVSVVGAILNFVGKLYIYVYEKGYSSYFGIPEEYLIINYDITIYNGIEGNAIKPAVR